MISHGSSGFFALEFGTVMAWTLIWNLHMMGGTLERGGARCRRRAVDVRWSWVERSLWDCYASVLAYGIGLAPRSIQQLTSSISIA